MVLALLQLDSNFCFLAVLSSVTAAATVDFRSFTDESSAIIFEPCFSVVFSNDAMRWDNLLTSLMQVHSAAGAFCAGENIFFLLRSLSCLVRFTSWLAFVGD